MKPVLMCICVLFCLYCHAQPKKNGNVFIVTTDGFRWEEVFKGADSSLISDTESVKDTLLTKQMFWAATADLRRQKLLPFFWNVISKQGSIYGNRLFHNKVDVKNIYKISYPGYNEMLTGFADPVPILNWPILNKNSNVLEYLNKQEGYKGKVVAFSSWSIMPYILNEGRSNFSVNSGYEMLEVKTELNNDINTIQKNAQPSKTRNDQLTYLSAKEYVERNHPKVVFLGLGETDEYAHHGEYDMYLQKAAAFDKMIADLWYYIQTDPFYKDNTTVIITTDHGRGKGTNTWRGHGFWVKGSGEAWLAMIGPGILPQGEINTPQQLWQKQIASTIALLTGQNFTARHPVAHPIMLPAKYVSSNIYLTKIK